MTPAPPEDDWIVVPEAGRVTYSSPRGCATELGGADEPPTTLLEPRAQMLLELMGGWVWFASKLLRSITLVIALTLVTLFSYIDTDADNFG